MAEQAARTPDAIAVSCGSEAITYAELVESAGQVAARLGELGVQPDDVVPVVAERCVGLVVTLLGVLTASAAYLALEPELPASRATLMLKDVQRRAAFSPGGASALLDGYDTVIPLDAPADAGRPPAENGARVRAAPAAFGGRLAYVSFTSGSTGEPKGVCVPHDAVVRLVRDPDWCRFRPEDTFLQLAPVAFDASTLEIWAPLTTGSRLVVMPPGPLDLAELAATLAERRVTVLWLSAGLFSRFADRHLDALGSVRHLLVGGDVVSPRHVRMVLDRHPGMTFTNGYGPTENTTFTTCWTTLDPPAEDLEALPIGRAISGTRVQLLRDDLTVCGPGETGQIYASGDGLARGYFNAPAATAERFVPDPHSPGPGGRMYATGDLGRWTAGGDLEFLGRVDRQIKIRGYRVEPAEIEAALLRTGEVREALVMARRGADGDVRLAAFAVPAGAAPCSARAAAGLRGRVARTLMPYMVPATITLVDAFPLGPTGKIDHDRLAALERTDEADPLQSETATGVLENASSRRPEPRLTRLWAQYLRTEHVGIDDDFFDLGGHSLVAAELLDAVQHDFGILIPARTLYLNPTVRELAAQIVAQTQGTTEHNEGGSQG
ncbi:non-ribosomal peptide synthetase [Actinomadura formosensis]|uniref:non-ribosomal peptide synthetase n=1 Tax=Actinomadura formosensis TaxID=60706 RepID=UPI00082D2E0F|nr:non-ribosomal peptide synthetase [Actinomadura formosensis]